VRSVNTSRGFYIQATAISEGGNNIYGKLKYVEIKLLTKPEYFDIFHNLEYPESMVNLITIYLREVPILAIKLV
jgi:hypothetical protein